MSFGRWKKAAPPSLVVNRNHSDNSCCLNPFRHEVRGLFWTEPSTPSCIVCWKHQSGVISVWPWRRRGWHDAACAPIRPESNIKIQLPGPVGLSPPAGTNNSSTYCTLIRCNSIRICVQLSVLYFFDRFPLSPAFSVHVGGLVVLGAVPTVLSARLFLGVWLSLLNLVSFRSTSLQHT